jgi:hypothetical protein
MSIKSAFKKKGQLLKAYVSNQFNEKNIIDTFIQNLGTIQVNPIISFFLLKINQHWKDQVNRSG